MTVFSLAIEQAQAPEEAPIQILKRIWGVVVQGEEPWRSLIVKSRALPGTSLAYDKAKGETLVVSLHDAVWDLRVFKERPLTVEETLRRGSLPPAWRVVYRGHDAVDAAGAFVRWCLS